MKTRYMKPKPGLRGIAKTSFAGLFGGHGGAGMIGQSVINIESGLSYPPLHPPTAGVRLLILVISLSGWLARISMAALGRGDAMVDRSAR